MITRMFRPALAYWALIFVLVFLLGAARVLWLGQLLGETLAVLAELPIMLAASALAARWALRRWKVVEKGEAFTLGALAFAFLILVEALLTAFLTGHSPAQWIADFVRPPALYALLGQIAFGLMPLLLVRRRRG